MNNISRTIGWAKESLNLVVGCTSNCVYCYAKRLNSRFHFVDNWNEPKFFPDRLNQFEKKKPTSIFINSMSDISDWEIEWIEKLITAINDNPQHKYIALTKDFTMWFIKLNYIINKDKSKWLPLVANFKNKLFIGETFTKQAEFFQRYITFSSKNIADFINIEPILDSIYLPYSLLTNSACKGIIIGAETGNRKGKVIPKKEWIENICRQADGLGMKVFMKDSLIPIVGEKNMRRELIWI